MALDPPAESLAENRGFTALPLLVLALTGSGLAMGIVGALQSLPDLAAMGMCVIAVSFVFAPVAALRRASLMPR